MLICLPQLSNLFHLCQVRVTIVVLDICNVLQWQAVNQMVVSQLVCQ